MVRLMVVLPRETTIALKVLSAQGPPKKTEKIKRREVEGFCMRRRKKRQLADFQTDQPARLRRRRKWLTFCPSLIRVGIICGILYRTR